LQRAARIVIRGNELDGPATDDERKRRSAEPHEGFYHHGEARQQFERVWDQASYATLTALLGTVPVHWRYFVKHRIFEAVDDQCGVSAETTVKRIFGEVLNTYPQLAAAMTKRHER
jgi:N-methylhydantoinase B